MRTDLGELDAPVAESLDRARLSHRMRLDPQDASVSAMTRNASEAVATLVPDGMRLHVMDLQGPADVEFCEPPQIERAIVNLLKNAMRHAKTEVRLSAESNADRTWIHVDDDGPASTRATTCGCSSRSSEPTSARRSGPPEPRPRHRAVDRRAPWRGAVIARSPLGGARVSLYW